jgi:glucose-1-phosphate thymidylyltransferase
MAKFKGIILAGGKGTRLYPTTNVASKQLLPIYNKPMIYYPLTTMLLSGVREVLIISSPEDTPRFESLLGDGSSCGIKLEYAVQDAPRGIAEALVIGREFVGDDSVFLMLGDNLIYGNLDFLRMALRDNGEGATIFGYRVKDPTAFGVAEFDDRGRVISLEEKPSRPKSDWAVPGLYVYGPGVADLAESLAPSGRGELEITDLNRKYLEKGALRCHCMGRGIAWLDTGTPDNLLEAAQFVMTLETRQGLMVGSPEEAAYRMGYLDRAGLTATVSAMPKSSEYRQVLERVLDEQKSTLRSMPEVA